MRSEVGIESVVLRKDLPRFDPSWGAKACAPWVKGRSSLLVLISFLFLSLFALCLPRSSSSAASLFSLSLCSSSLRSLSISSSLSFLNLASIRMPRSQVAPRSSMAATSFCSFSARASRSFELGMAEETSATLSEVKNDARESSRRAVSPESAGGTELDAPMRLGVELRLRLWRASRPFLPVPFWLGRGGMAEGILLLSFNIGNIPAGW